MSGVDTWIKGFLAGERQDTILVIAGPAASGKTRFVQALVNAAINVGADPSHVTFHHADERVVRNAVADNSLVILEEVTPAYIKDLLESEDVRVEPIGRDAYVAEAKSSFIFLTRDEKVEAKVGTLRRFTFATPAQAHEALSNH